MKILGTTTLVASLLFATFASLANTEAEQSLSDTITTLEEKLGARVGVSLHDAGSGFRWGHRENERFLMNSTVKVPICGAILAQVEKGGLSLEETMPVKHSDLVEYAPVTETRVGKTVTLADLCFATLDQSDNAAANLLFKRLGSPAEVTTFLRGIGDIVTRSDRLEPELNKFAPDDPRDTTSPAAMVATLEALLTGDVLAPASRAQLAQWMRPGGVTGKLLRPAVPQGWDVVDKSGSGDASRNLVALVTPPDQPAIAIALFISDTKADFATRNQALIDLSKAVMEMVIAARGGR